MHQGRPIKLQHAGGVERGKKSEIWCRFSTAIAFISPSFRNEATRLYTVFESNNRPICCRSTFGTRGFSVDGQTVWNLLPNLRDPAADSKQFRRDLKTYLFARHSNVSALEGFTRLALYKSTSTFTYLLAAQISYSSVTSTTRFLVTLKDPCKTRQTKCGVLWCFWVSWFLDLKCYLCASFPKLQSATRSSNHIYRRVK